MNNKSVTIEVAIFLNTESVTGTGWFWLGIMCWYILSIGLWNDVTYKDWSNVSREILWQVLVSIQLFPTAVLYLIDWVWLTDSKCSISKNVSHVAHHGFKLLKVCDVYCLSPSSTHKSMVAKFRFAFVFKMILLNWHHCSKRINCKIKRAAQHFQVSYHFQLTAAS